MKASDVLGCFPPDKLLKVAQTAMRCRDAYKAGMGALEAVREIGLSAEDWKFAARGIVRRVVKEAVEK